MLFTSAGKELRLTRLSRPVDGRFLFVPLDHAVSDGPFTVGGGFGRLVRSLAAELGADLVKTTSAVPMELMAQVVEASPIPVLVAGGPSDGSDVAAYARCAIEAGCAGLCVGRRVFEHPSPVEAVAVIAEIVHRRSDQPDFSPLLTRVLAGTL